MTLFGDRRAIRSLRVGVVPSSHVLELTVGINAVAKNLDREIESLKQKRQNPCVVSAEWGMGKSNLLSYLREYCLRRNVAVCYINLNGSASAASHPQRFYHRIVADLRLPDTQRRGLANLLGSSLQTANGLDAISRWGKANAHKSELADALVDFLNGHRQWAVQRILGADLSWANYGYKKEKAIRRIGDLGDFLRSLGYGGLMIQYDELETVGQLWNVRSRQSAYKILYSLTGLKSVWSVCATTDRLGQQLYVDEKSGKLFDVEALHFISRYKRLPLLNPPVIDARLAAELLRHVEALYRRVYDMPANVNVDQVLDRWLRMPFRNPRRLIRHAIDYLDRTRPVPNLIKIDDED